MNRYIDLMDLWGFPSIDDQILALAKRLRLIRRERGFSQAKFSDLSGIPLGTLKIFERKGQISLKHLFQYAKALGLESELNCLFREKEPTLEDMRNGK